MSCSKLALASLFIGSVGAAVAVAARPVQPGRPAVGYKLHVYDHCPFCNRVEFLMEHFNLPYERVVYGYGEGADPSKCDGNGYGTGPVALMGKKMLPVLEGGPLEAMMCESLEVCAFLIAQNELVVPCASGRSDLARFMTELNDVARPLTRTRMFKMPVADWKDERDTAYAVWKYSKAGFDYSSAEAASADHLASVNVKLEELPGLLRGAACLNTWGWGMDDVLLLPILRSLTVAKGVIFPAAVKHYFDTATASSQMADYRDSAC